MMQSTLAERFNFAFALLVLSVCAQSTFAQPPDVPSTIKKPLIAPIAPVVLDPPPISLLELETSIGGPTLVTFSGRDVPIGAAIKALFEAAKIPEADFENPNPNQTVSVDWNQTPFWEAVADLEKQTGKMWDGRWGNSLGLVPFGTGAGFGLEGSQGVQNPLVTLIGNTLTRNTTRVAPMAKAARTAPQLDRLQMVLCAYFDPKLKVQFSNLRSVQFRLQNKTTRVPVVDHHLPLPVRAANSGFIQQIKLPFLHQVAAGTTLSRVSGILHTVIISGTETWNVPDLVAARLTAKTVGANRYTIRAVSINENQLTLRLGATFGHERGQILNLTPRNVFSSLRVRDAQGRELLRVGSSHTVADYYGEFSFALTNAKGEPMVGPYSLEWPIVSQTRSFDVPFELRDVVVP